jgi:hypothetical protein
MSFGAPRPKSAAGSRGGSGASTSRGAGDKSFGYLTQNSNGAHTNGTPRTHGEDAVAAGLAGRARQLRPIFTSVASHHSCGRYSRVLESTGDIRNGTYVYEAAQVVS